MRPQSSKKAMLVYKQSKPHATKGVGHVVEHINLLPKITSQPGLTIMFSKNSLFNYHVHFNGISNILNNNIINSVLEDRISLSLF